MARLPNIHPGEVLREEFLLPMKITPYRLAKELRVPATRIAEILKEKRGISPDTALRLSAFFGTTPEFWIGLQVQFDLEEVRLHSGDEFREIRRYVSQEQFAA